MRCTNCSASSRVSNIIRLYNRPARTWSHLHIVSVIAFPPSNRLSSRLSSQSKSAYLSSVSLLFTSTPFRVISRTLHARPPHPTLKKRGAPLKERPSHSLRPYNFYGLHLLLFIHVDILCINYAFVLLRLF